MGGMPDPNAPAQPKFGSQPYDAYLAAPVAWGLGMAKNTQKVADFAKSAVTGVADNVRTVGDTVTGKMDPMSDEGFGRIQNIALGMMGGGTAFGSAPKGATGMFIGPNHPLYDFGMAQKTGLLEKKLMTPRQIWPQTMNYRGMDNILWQEIPDQMYANTDHLANQFDRTNKMPRLGEVLPHPRLFQGKHYGQLGQFPVWPVKSGGTFRPMMRMFELPTGETMGHSVEGVIGHEVQHGIHDLEGGAAGAAPEYFEDGAEFAHLRRPGEDPYETYMRSHGENMANATRDRWNMGMDMRRATFPEDNMPRPIKDQFLQYDPWNEPRVRKPGSAPPGMFGKIRNGLRGMK